MGTSEDEISIKSEKGSPSKQENTNSPCSPDWPSIQVATPQTADLLTKIPDKINQGSTKKLKRLAELAVQATYGSAGFDAIGVAHEASKSVVIGASSNGSDGNSEAYRSQNTSNPMALFPTEVNGRVRLQAYTIPVEAAKVGSGRVSAITMASENVEGNSVRSLNVKGQTSTVSSTAKFHLEDIRQLKLQRRKESNRESARKSRMKKQDAFEELLASCESLAEENKALKSERDRLTKESEKLSLENALLTEKLNNAQLEQAERESKAFGIV